MIPTLRTSPSWLKAIPWWDIRIAHLTLAHVALLQVNAFRIRWAVGCSIGTLINNWKSMISWVFRELSGRIFRIALTMLAFSSWKMVRIRGDVDIAGLESRDCHGWTIQTKLSTPFLTILVKFLYFHEIFRIIFFKFLNKIFQFSSFWAMSYWLLLGIIL